MRRLALAAAVVAAATAVMQTDPARADAYPYVPPGAAIAAGYDWTGIYVGGQVGGAHASTKWSFSGTFDDIKNTDTGFAGGAFVGLQKHWLNMVFGAEVAYTWADLEGSKLSATAPGVTLTSEARNLLLVTGKFGYTWDYILAYAKGGWASGDVDFRTTSAGVVTTASSDRESGWTAALGLEFALRPNIILGVEYDYVRLNVSGRDHTAAPAGFPGGQIGDAGVDIQTVMARISYKFGPRPEPLPGPIK